jgi:hypothetical protein
MREIAPTVSTRWVALGYSQGGQAVWAANELNNYYGEGLELAGSVALAPAANVTGVADLAWSRSLTDDQQAIFPLLIMGLSRYTPDFDEHAFLHGAAEARIETLNRCEQTGTPRETTAAPQSLMGRIAEWLGRSNELRPASPQDLVELRDALRSVALPQRPLTEPMLVLTGESDALVLPEWVRSAVSDSCALGGRIEFQQVPDVDHRDIVWKPRHTIMRWIADRFAGSAAPSNCAGAHQ